MSSSHISRARHGPVCQRPVDPATLVGDAWMNDPVARADFERGLKEFDEAMKPLTDAIRNSERLTQHDLDIVINTRG
jgi:hypothetical protein